MNIISVLVGVSIAGVATPHIAEMSLAPIIAQKRANNFAVAESTAVGYAAMNEGLSELTPLPDGCTTVELDGNAYTVTCTHGEGQFKTSVSRSFRLAAICEDGNNGHGNDNGDYDCSNPGNGTQARIKYTPGVFCPLWDPWGVINYNDSHNVQCIPVPYGPWASTYDGEMLW